MMKTNKRFFALLLFALWLAAMPAGAAAEPGKLVAPQLTYLPPIVFSEAVSDTYAGQKLNVVLRIDLTDQGTVSADSVQVVESSGDASVDQAVIAAVKAAVFSPAYRDGQAAAITIRLPLAVQVPEKAAAEPAGEAKR